METQLGLIDRLGEQSYLADQRDRRISPLTAAGENGSIRPARCAARSRRACNAARARSNSSTTIATAMRSIQRLVRACPVRPACRHDSAIGAEAAPTINEWAASRSAGRSGASAACPSWASSCAHPRGISHDASGIRADDGIELIQASSSRISSPPRRSAAQHRRDPQARRRRRCRPRLRARYLSAGMQAVFELRAGHRLGD